MTDEQIKMEIADRDRRIEELMATEKWAQRAYGILLHLVNVGVISDADDLIAAAPIDVKELA